MRAPNRHLLACLAVSVAVAAGLAAASTASQAQFRTNSFSVGPRAPMLSPTFRADPRFERFNSDRTGDELGRGKGGGKGGDLSGAGGDDGRPGRHPPRGHRPPIRGPVVIGTGVAVGTGLVPPLPPGGPASAGSSAPRRAIAVPPASENRFVKDEVVLEFIGAFPPAGIAQVLRRHRLALLESQLFTLTNTTVVRARINGGRSVRAVLREIGNESTVAAGQPNFIYIAAEQQGPRPLPENAAAAAAPPTAAPASAAALARPTEGDPAQYVLGKLHLNEAHTVSNGDKVVVAVIDSGIDLSHPELARVVTGSFDALGKAEKPHLHGTAIAGAIAAHGRLMGAAPAANILAIRAFGAAGNSAEATTFAILKGLEYATQQHARIVNMSFAGPADPGLGRALAAAKTKGAVLIAAAGNFGPKSPPQYPAADPNVIAVSGTDAEDRIFRASNIGPHIAVAAPGVDLLLPAPDNDYQVISGTSFSAAYVSGVAALIIQQAPALTPDAVREVLQKTAKDLGRPGKDPEFGAGLVDAYQAVMAVQPPSASAAPAASVVPAAQ